MSTDLNSGDVHLYDFSHIPDRDNPDTAMWVNNVLSLNEWRRSRNLSSLPGGDVVFQRHIEMAAKYIAGKLKDADLPVPSSIPVPLEVAVAMADRMSKVKVLDDRPLGFYINEDQKPKQEG